MEIKLISAPNWGWVELRVELGKNSLKPKWIPVKGHWMEVNIGVIPFSKVGTAPIETPSWQL